MASERYEMPSKGRRKFWLAAGIGVLVLVLLEKRLLVYNPRPSEFLTKDKKNLVIDNYVAWRIREPNKFVQSVGDAVSAEMRLHDIVWSAVSAALGNLELSALVSAEPKARARPCAYAPKPTRNGSRSWRKPIAKPNRSEATATPSPHACMRKRINATRSFTK